MPIKNNKQNINALWADLIIEELRRCGVEYFCVAPGSRSAPLALAVARNPMVKSVVHFDERGLGFHALGITSATTKPTAIITTSGTAVANLFPSIIEAGKKKLPLIIVTADRPPELRATGANQTIDQVKIFGDHVRFFFDLPCPTTEITPETVLTTVDQIVNRAKGELAGPVHLNCMFREPLAPHHDTKDYSLYLKTLKPWKNSTSPYTSYAKTQTVLSSDAEAQAAIALESIKNGIIAVGKISGPREEEAVLKLAARLNWPVFADVTSGLRLGRNEKNLIHHFDHILSSKIAGKLQVDGILHLGGRLTSNRWLSFVKARTLKNYIMVIKHPLRNDPQHLVTLRLQASVADFCIAMNDKISARKPSGLLKQLQKVENQIEKACAKYFAKQSVSLTEPAIANALTKMLPQNTGLFIGNSMPIRELNLFGSSQGATVRITANRGASGIDGNIATAAGFAKGGNIACTALIGDLAFLYDLNSLSLLQNINKSFILIVVNNNGGAIFSFLPVAESKSGFERFFTTPHHMTFASAAELFGLSYNFAETINEFSQTYQAALRKKGATIIELKADTQNTMRAHRAIQAQIDTIR